MFKALFEVMIKKTLKASVSLFLISSAYAGLTIDLTYKTGTWEDAMKVVAEDAAKEWEAVYCKPITIFIDLTWHDFGDNSWGLTRNFKEDPYLKLPFSADVELNTRIADKYWWDPTPWDITDDASTFGSDKIDAASVLKHEIFHAIGFATGYTRYADKVKTNGDIDKDGDDDNYLDFNNNGKYDAGETVLADGNNNHTSDSFYKGKSDLMGYPGFGLGEQARPSSIEIAALNGVYGYPIHIPTPGSLILASIGLGFIKWQRKRMTL